MSVQFAGSNNAGTTPYYIGGNLAFVFPTSFQGQGSSPILRNVKLTSRTGKEISFALYVSDTDSLSNATLAQELDGELFLSDVDTNIYHEHIFDVSWALDPTKFYWLAFRFLSTTSSYIHCSNGGTPFHSIDSYDFNSANAWPSPVGATSAYTRSFNFYAEVVDADSKVTQTIGASPDSSIYSLLKDGAQYQAENAQVRYDEFSTNLNNVTVFDTGLFLIGGEGSDSFEYELAAPSQSYDTAKMSAITDTTVEVGV